MKEPVLIHHHLKDVNLEQVMDPFSGETTYRAIQNIYVTAQKKLDAALTEACLRYCQENGCSDLYMVDGEELVRRLRLASLWDKLKQEMTEALAESSKRGPSIADGAYLYVLTRMRELEKVDEEVSE